MELRHLRYFVAVAEELHFGRAARRLHMSQPPLSSQIRDLEAEVGAPLLTRAHHAVSLTPAGTALLARARGLLGEAEAMKREAAGIAQGELGTLTVGYTTTAMYVVLPALLRTFRAAHPRISLRLEEMASATQAPAIVAGKIDVGFVCLPVPVERLAMRVVATDAMVVALPRGHRLARQATVRLADVVARPMVSVRPSVEPGWASAFQAVLAERGFVPTVAQEADTKLALLGLVAAGAGVALVTSSLATLARPGVVFRRVTDVRARFALGMIWSPERTSLTERFVRAAPAKPRGLVPARSLASARAATHGATEEGQRKRQRGTGRARQ